MLKSDFYGQCIDLWRWNKYTYKYWILKTHFRSLPFPSYFMSQKKHISRAVFDISRAWLGVFDHLGLWMENPRCLVVESQHIQDFYNHGLSFRTYFFQTWNNITIGTTFSVLHSEHQINTTFDRTFYLLWGKKRFDWFTAANQQHDLQKNLSAWLSVTCHGFPLRTSHLRAGGGGRNVVYWRGVVSKCCAPKVIHQKRFCAV